MVGVGGVLLTGPAASVAQTPTYSIAKPGLYGGDHQSQQGVVASSVVDTSPSGDAIIGVSSRYLGIQVNGSAAWVYRAGQTIRLGLLDGEHTSGDGQQWSRPAGLTRPAPPGDGSGPGGPGGAVVGVAGVSRRFAGFDALGQSAWLAMLALPDGSGGGVWSYRVLGLRDGAHTSDIGERFSAVAAVCPCGAVGGDSRRYLGAGGGGGGGGGGGDVGQSAWVFAGDTIAAVGLVDLEHTRPDGLVYSQIQDGLVSDDGAFAGFSRRYGAGGEALGQTAWLWRAGVLTRVGFTGPGYRDAAGLQFSAIVGLNGAGDAAGYSFTQIITGPYGRAAWRRRAETGQTERIGLRDSEHTKDGFQVSQPEAINARGDIIGFAEHYVNGARGQSTWIDRVGGATQRIGLLDGEHTRANGNRFARTTLLTDSGRVAGVSTRYASSLEVGQSAWVFDGVTSRRVGLLDGPHRSSGSPSARLVSQVSAMNARGDSAGQSARYSAGVLVGYSGWFFDSASGDITPLVFSVGEREAAYTTISHVTDEGTVIGGYIRYEANQQVQRAFLWTRETGFRDLGSLVLGGLQLNGWSALEEVSRVRAGSAAYIVGNGRAEEDTSGGSVYLLMRGPDRACRADVNADGQVDPDDLADFIGDYFGGRESADFNLDGVVDPDDLSDCIVAFFAGC